MIFSPLRPPVRPPYASCKLAGLEDQLEIYEIYHKGGVKAKPLASLLSFRRFHTCPSVCALQLVRSPSRARFLSVS